MLSQGVARCLCKNCYCELQEYDLMIILDGRLYQELSNQRQQIMLNSFLKQNNMVRCVQCQNQFEFIDGSGLTQAAWI